MVIKVLWVIRYSGIVKDNVIRRGNDFCENSGKGVQKNSTK